MAKQRKSEHSIPYIYGYRSFRRRREREFRQLAKDGEDRFRFLLNEGLSRINFSGAFDERGDQKKQYRDYIKLILEGWLVYELIQRLHTFLYDTQIEVYELGINDGKRKLIDAVRQYNGEYKTDKNKIIRGIRTYEVSVPITVAAEVRSLLDSDIALYDDWFRGGFASDASDILVQKRLSSEEKTGKVTGLVNGYFRKNGAGNRLLSLRNTALVTGGLILANEVFFVERVRWVVNAPIDSPCYSDDTELLTKQGWRNIDTIAKDDDFISLTQDQQIEFVKAKNLIRKSYKGKMVHFKNKNMDLLVTPDHNVCYVSEDAGRMITHGRRRESRKLNFDFKRADTDFPKKFFMPKASENRDGIEIEKKDLGNGIVLEGDDYIRLMAWWLGDGSLQGGAGIFISQHREKSKETAQEVLFLCKKIGKYTNSNITQIEAGVSIWGKRWEKYFKQFGKARDKFIPDDILGCSVRQARLFLETYLKGDGHERHYLTRVNKNPSIAWHFFTSSPMLSAHLGILSLKIGNGASYRYIPEREIKFKNGTYLCKDSWKIGSTFSKNVIIERDKNIDYVDYDGEVWCVELERNHTLFTRRNGKCVWSGNCVMATGEIVQRGNLFSNGFRNPPCHRHCQCSLETVGVTDYYIQKLRGFLS